MFARFSSPSATFGCAQGGSDRISDEHPGWLPVSDSWYRLRIYAIMISTLFHGYRSLPNANLHLSITTTLQPILSLRPHDQQLNVHAIKKNLRSSDEKRRLAEASAMVVANTNDSCTMKLNLDVPFAVGLTNIFLLIF